ncbi:MAG TPA: hypothetical protein VHD35_07985 [Chitinophagaceae bacterium]|nr:hypothetical protein [Chitinophagaceae bacterium]
MPSLDPTQVQINSVVVDFLFIQIKTAFDESTKVNYRIIDSNQQVVRKGNFTGLYVQLRLDHIKDGFYSLELLIDNFDPLLYKFEKRTPKDSEGMVVRVY